jgi:hypothetical protein
MSSIILSPGIKNFAYPNVLDILNQNFSIQQYNNLIQIANSNNLWQAIDEDSNRNECGWLNSLVRICTVECQT